MSAFYAHQARNGAEVGDLLAAWRGRRAGRLETVPAPRQQMRHEDIAAAECEISIVPRENANGARAKSGARTVPVGPDLIRLYADYLHEEYGGIDSDLVFVIWAEERTRVVVSGGL